MNSKYAHKRYDKKTCKTNSKKYIIKTFLRYSLVTLTFLSMFWKDSVYPF